VASGIEYLTEGMAAYERGHWQVCVDALEKALAQGFENPLYRLEGQVLLGRAYAQLGHTDRARSYFQEVLKLQPDYRLDPVDPAGMEVYQSLIQDSSTSVEATDPPGFPMMKVVLGVGVAAATILIALMAGGGDGAGTPEGAVEGVLVLP